MKNEQRIKAEANYHASIKTRDKKKMEAARMIAIEMRRLYPTESEKKKELDSNKYYF